MARDQSVRVLVRAVRCVEPARFALVGLAALLLLSACGGDGEPVGQAPFVPGRPDAGPGGNGVLCDNPGGGQQPSCTPCLINCGSGVDED